MSDNKSTPGYMGQLLEELGWNQGTRIPLANAENQTHETILLSRQNEIQRLKEALISQNQKCQDLNKYKEHVHSEYHENTRLLFAHKQQLEQEVKIKQLSINDADSLDRDVMDCNKQSKDIITRVERVQGNIARLLKKADTLKSEVCGERGALQEWRAALERSACDITAIEQFTKQDLSKAKALQTKREKLKLEHDHVLDRLNLLVSNINAEERACERISVQVIEGMEQRKQMMQMWAAAVENLRQRDTDIRHIREDYVVLEAEANDKTEQCREQQAFFDQQRGNNNEAQRENMGMAQRLSQIRLTYQQMYEENVTLDSEAQSLQRELSNMHNALEKLHMENRRIMEEQHRKDIAIQTVISKINELKEKLKDSLDKSKTSEKRAKELEAMLNEEEHYASQLTVNRQRVMHCSFVEQQKLLALKNEEKLYRMQVKASKAIMSKLDTKQREMERSLQNQRETLYAACYQVETIGARIAHMEGLQAERNSSQELVEREERLKDVYARHAARVALLERHSAKLLDDMRYLTRDMEDKTAQNTKLQSRLKTSMLNIVGSDKDLRLTRDLYKKSRVEEALTKLRVAHASRAVAGLDDAAFTLHKQRLQLDAAMNERLVEIAARRDIFSVQKRALVEDCGKLRAEIKERENRVLQLQKRYDIFIASLGKDDSGQQLSVTFFKIKFASDRAELRERGAALDADIARRERDVSALEATLRVVHAAHTHFIRHINPIPNTSPEMEELNELTKQYYSLRDELKEINSIVASLEQNVSDASSRLTMLVDKSRQLSTREAEIDNEFETARDRVARQESVLQNARAIVKRNVRRAKKVIESDGDWRSFQMALWIRDYAEAAQNSLQSLSDVCSSVSDAYSRFIALVAATDIQRHLSKHQRRLQVFVERILGRPVQKESYGGLNESVFSSASSSKSGESIVSGYTKRLSAFRKTLSIKVQDEALLQGLPAPVASAVSLCVVSLDYDQSSIKQPSKSSSRDK